MTVELVSLTGAAMARSREDSQKVVSYAISGALLLLLSLGYLFVPRLALDDRSPLAVLTSPTKKEIFICAGTRPLNLGEALESIQSENACTGKYQGHWQKDLNNDSSVRTKGYGWSHVGNLIFEDLLGTGGLLLLIGASPTIGFLAFRRIRRTDLNLKMSKITFPAPQQNKRETISSPKATSRQLEDRLTHLQSLHQKGLITSEEFLIKKKDLLEEI